MTYKETIIDPLREGHPEPFPMPRTIPTGWDLSDNFSSLDLSMAEVNGTAYDKTTGFTNDRKNISENAV